MAFVEPASVPLHPVKMEPVDDSGEDSEAVCRGNENEDDEDMAVPDPTSMLSVRLEEEEPSSLKISIEPAPPPAVRDKDHHKDDEEHPLSQTSVDAADLSPTAAEKQTQKPALYLCEKCPNAFKTETEFIAHVESHKIRKAHPCDKCEKSFNRKSELNVHSRTHCEVKPFACHLCEKTFAQKNNLLRHLRTHSGEKPFQCSLCSRTFAQKELLTAHIRIHTGERPYSCLVCGQAFNQRHTLTRHVREHANRETGKVFSCSQCGKMFPRQVNLDIHMRTHTGEKPFECEMCGKRFSQSGHLARHKLTHTGKTPYPCPICGKGFSQKKRLVDHARTHTGERPFKCQYCPKNFTHAEYLKSHLHTHREEKYICPMCNEMFSRKYKLREHMRIHSSEWPLQCAHCKACFISKRDIAVHIHSQHLLDIMGDGAAPAEKSHVNSVGNTGTGSDEPGSLPYCKIKNEDSDGEIKGTLAAGFTLPSDEEEQHKSDILLENSDVVRQKHHSPEHTGTTSETVTIFIKEERISDEEDVAHLTSDKVSTVLPPQIFPGSVPITEPTVIIKEEVDTLVEDPLCLISEIAVNTSELSLATGVSREIKLSANTEEDTAASLEKQLYLQQVVSERSSKEKQIASVKAEVMSDNEYLRIHQNEGMQESLVSGSVKMSDSIDGNLLTSPEHPLCLESGTASKGSLGTLVSDLSSKITAPVDTQEELNSSGEYPLCLRNDAIFKILPTPLAPDTSGKIYSAVNSSEGTAKEIQCPLFLGKDREHKILPLPSISGSSTSAKLSSSVRELSMSNVGGPLCLKNRTVPENLSLNIFPEITSGTEQSTIVQNSISSSEVPPCLKRDIGSKHLGLSSLANVDSDTGLRAGTEEHLVQSSRHCLNSSTSTPVPVYLTSSFIQKTKLSDVSKEDRLIASDHPLCLKRNAVSDDLPSSHLPSFVNKMKTKISIRKDLVPSLESPLCLKSNTKCQSFQDPFVPDIRKITVPSGTTVTVSAPGDNEICNVSDALVSYQQMLYDRVLRSPSVFRE